MSALQIFQKRVRHTRIDFECHKKALVEIEFSGIFHYGPSKVVKRQPKHHRASGNDLCRDEGPPLSKHSLVQCLSNCVDQSSLHVEFASREAENLL